MGGSQTEWAEEWVGGGTRRHTFLLFFLDVSVRNQRVGRSLALGGRGGVSFSFPSRQSFSSLLDEGGEPERTEQRSPELRGVLLSRCLFLGLIFQ